MNVLKTIGAVFLLLLTFILWISCTDSLANLTIPIDSSNDNWFAFITGFAIITCIFSWLAFRIIRTYQYSEYSVDFHKATPAQKNIAIKINNSYIEIAKKFQDENGSFAESENWLHLWAACFWLNQYQLRQQGFDTLVLGALREHLLAGVNSYMRTYNMMQKFAWTRSKLARKYPIDNESQRVLFAKYIADRLYETNHPNLTTPIWDYLTKSILFTKKALADYPIECKNQTSATPDQPHINKTSTTNTSLPTGTEKTTTDLPNETTKNELNASLSKTNTKQRFCKHCGSIIDADTKKCTSCGKQYFHLPKPHKHTVIIIIAAILIVSLAGLNIYQYISSTEYREAFKQQEDMKQQIAELKDDIGKKDARILSLENQNYRIEQEYNFYKDNVVITTNKDNFYHKYFCGELASMESWFSNQWLYEIGSYRLYNTNAARSAGYSPCPECIN